MQKVIISSPKVEDNFPSITTPFPGLRGQMLQLLFPNINEIELALALALVRAARSHEITLTAGFKPVFVVMGGNCGDILGDEPGPKVGLIIEQRKELILRAPAPVHCSPLREAFQEMAMSLPGLFDRGETVTLRSDLLHPVVALLVANAILIHNPKTVRVLSTRKRRPPI